MTKLTDLKIYSNNIFNTCKCQMNMISRAVQYSYKHGRVAYVCGKTTSTTVHFDINGTGHFRGKNNGS